MKVFAILALFCASAAAGECKKGLLYCGHTLEFLGISDQCALNAKLKRITDYENHLFECRGPGSAKLIRLLDYS
ncbi:hypothetical protein GQ602_001050 [Ophiocordyceps camponoti-floridani]|uniref:Uncharacterized protein n=1 Tax=Ophiocordyceps camponoti-floridani TaxID=2030778 RepID=A0A8H4VGQ3_9HYPO|nr:hypothetical protein GQ602_001050 [Ophiocordyceps camponoti-floridani]